MNFRSFFCLTSAVSLLNVASAGAEFRVISGDEIAKKPYSAIGRIELKRRDGGFGQCSATLIRDRWLLTAAHCFYDIATGVWTTSAKFQFSDEIGIGASRVLKRVWIDRVSGIATRDHDYALVELAFPVQGRAQGVAMPGEHFVPACGAGYPALGFRASHLGSVMIESCGYLSASEDASIFRINGMDVNGGHSGAPLFYADERSQPWLVGVVGSRMTASSGDVRVMASGTLLSKAVQQKLSDRMEGKPDPVKDRRISEPEIASYVFLGMVQPKDVPPQFLITLLGARRSPGKTRIFVELNCDGKIKTKRFDLKWSRAQRKQLKTLDSMQLTFERGEPSSCQLKLTNVVGLKGMTSFEYTGSVK